MHETVAECMIFANHWVAKKIFESYSTNALVIAIDLTVFHWSL